MEPPFPVEMSRKLIPEALKIDDDDVFLTGDHYRSNQLNLIAEVREAICKQMRSGQYPLALERTEGKNSYDLGGGLVISKITLTEIMNEVALTFKTKTNRLYWYYAGSSDPKKELLMIRLQTLKWSFLCWECWSSIITAT
jgi:hypothetical protein